MRPFGLAEMGTPKVAIVQIRLKGSAQHMCVKRARDDPSGSQVSLANVA